MPHFNSEDVGLDQKKRRDCLGESLSSYEASPFFLISKSFQFDVKILQKGKTAIIFLEISSNSHISSSIRAYPSKELYQKLFFSSKIQIAEIHANI